MSTPATQPATRRSRRLAGRPIGLKIGAALTVLAVVASGLTTMAGSRIGTPADAAYTRYPDSVAPLGTFGELQRTVQDDPSRPDVDEASRGELRAEPAERREPVEQQAGTDVATLDHPQISDRRATIAGTTTGVPTAADSTTQALIRIPTAVDELSRMAADPRTSGSRSTY